MQSERYRDVDKVLTNYQLQRAKVQGTPARLFTKANGGDKCLEE